MFPGGDFLLLTTEGNGWISSLASDEAGEVAWLAYLVPGRRRQSTARRPPRPSLRLQRGSSRRAAATATETSPRRRHGRLTTLSSQGPCSPEFP